MYQVWTKATYEEAWRLTECPDIADVEAIIRAGFGTDVETKVSTPVEYDAKITVKIHAPKEELSIKEKLIEDVKESIREVELEAAEGETKPDKGAGDKSHRKVR